MAGGKETPRQKMIGMMYLVLTALLALQVSSAIMEKFKLLDDSLQNANQITNVNNGNSEKKIAKAVDQAGNKEADKAVLKRANDVRNETSIIRKYLHSVRDKMIEVSGGREEDGNYKGSKEETAIEVYMVGTEGAKNGEGYKLKQQVNDFAAKIAKITGNQSLGKPLCLDGKDNPMFAKNPDQKAKDFANVSFAQTPMIAALAVISTIEADVLKLESQALEELAMLVGASDIKFDVVQATYTAKSSVVAAGTFYEAEVFLSASSTAIIPKVKVDGAGELKVEGGRGKLKFKAGAGAYDKEGNSKQTKKAYVTIANKGKDTTFEVKIEYIVSKPVIRVQSGNVSTLYVNCGNKLQIDVPALGAEYNPSFSTNGATIIKGSTKGAITVVPSGAVPKIRISVASSGTPIGVEDFGLSNIPKPEIVAMVNGKPVDEKNGMAAPGPRQITVVAQAEPNFAKALPGDSKYFVTEWNCMLVRGKRPVAQQRFSSGMGNITTFASQATPGDRILIEVTKVQRANFQGKREDVKIGTVIKNIPLN